ncbi:hypothetical protein GCM10029978_067410 [Actinoallomurus acanthiterrae]
MPKRGEHTDAVPVPKAERTASRRIGVRQVTLKANGRETTIVIDPSAYRCSRLVGELADEWESYIALAQGTPSGAYHYRSAILDFAQYVDEHCASPEAASLTKDHPDLAYVISEMWRTLPSKYREGSPSPGKRAHALRGLLRFRAQREDAAVADGLLRLISAPHSVPAGKTKELDEFSRQEKQGLVRAAWNGIRAVEDRLELGREMITDAAGHPDEHGWLDPRNLLWALARGELTTGEIFAGLPPFRQWPDELVELASMRTPATTRVAKFQLITVLVSLLYPRDEDLYGFQVLLMSATGRAPEEVTGMNVGDVEFTPGGVRLTMAKNRAHVLRHEEFGAVVVAAPVGGEAQTAAEVVRRLLAVTERARQDCDLDTTPLFLRAGASDQGRVLRFGRIGDTNPHGAFRTWTKAHGLELSQPVDIRRLRKSGKVEKVIARRGVVSDIADDHTVQTFKGHYAHGTTVHVISGHVVNQAQSSWFEAATNGPVSLDQAAAEDLSKPEALDAMGLTREEAGQIISGELDMGVANCRDPFDSPYSKQGELCAVAPLRCLECQNAFILPANLPQLLLFADHLQQLKLRLTPQHFHALWGQSMTNLQAVLRERTPAEINAARQQIHEEHLGLQLPLSARTEFDL